MSRERNIYLDCLRGMAAIAVMLYHYTTRYEELFGHVKPYFFSVPMGGQAVMLFFILCGYFSVSKKNISVATYTVKRFFRLYPVYWVAILITYPLVKYMLPSRSISLKEAVINFSMLQGFFGVGNVDGAYWTLQYELYFYVLVAGIIALRMYKHVGYLSIAWVFGNVILFFLPKVYVFNLFRKFFRIALMRNSYGHQFVGGVLLRCAEERICDLKQDKKYMVDTKLIVLVCSLAACTWMDAHWNGSNNAIVFVLFLLLVSAAILLNKAVPTSCVKPIMRVLYPLLLVAPISYPLYLVHQNVGYIIIQRMEQMGLTSEVCLVIPVLLMLGLAFILNKVVEHPCEKLSRKLCNKLMAKLQ